MNLVFICGLIWGLGIWEYELGLETGDWKLEALEIGDRRREIGDGKRETETRTRVPLPSALAHAKKILRSGTPPSL